VRAEKKVRRVAQQAVVPRRMFTIRLSAALLLNPPRDSRGEIRARRASAMALPPLAPSQRQRCHAVVRDAAVLSAFADPHVIFRPFFADVFCAASSMRYCPHRPRECARKRLPHHPRCYSSSPCFSFLFASSASRPLLFLIYCE